MNKTLWSVVGGLGLGLTIVPAILVFYGHLTTGTHKTYMAIGMILWFWAAPRLIKR
ncbi:MAG: hypothetical protein ACK4GN_03990 [Runella sp.]